MRPAPRQVSVREHAWLCTEPVKASHADVIAAIDAIPHGVRANRRFFGDREVSGPGSGNHNRTQAARRLPGGPGNGPGSRIERGVGNSCDDGGVCIGSRTGDEQALAGGNNALGDGRYLVGRLAKAENHLWKPRP